MGTQQFCLKWNNHQANMVTIFEQLLSTEALVDVTIACDGLSLKAHKMVLSACSPYFQSLFLENPCKHPIVIMRDMKYTELKAIIDFMYRGEVNVSHDQLNALLKTAETLKVKGLAEVCGERTSSGGVQQEVQQNAPSTPVHANATSTPVIGATHIPTRTDSPTLLSKRKRGRPRKRSLSDSNRSDDEQVPAKIKEPGSPDIEEISADTSLDTNISENISSNSQTRAPVTQFSKSSIVQSHQSSKSIQPAAMECQVEEPPSEDCDFELEPSKLMEQTLSTDVPKSTAAQNISSVQISSSSSNVNTALVPASVTSDFHSSQIEDPESPQDIKPVLLTFEEPPVAGTSQDSNSMMYMESPGVPSIPGTSFQDSEGGQIVQHDSQQGDPATSLPRSDNIIMPVSLPFRPAPQLFVLNSGVWQSHDDEIEIVEENEPEVEFEENDSEMSTSESQLFDPLFSAAFQMSPESDAVNSEKIDGNTPLPEFSDFIRTHLMENNLSAVWGKFIEECAKYYYGKFPNIHNSSEYQAIGKKMYQLHPSIESEGKEPWSFFCKSLSQKIRHIKWRNKRKNLPRSPRQMRPKMAKKRKVVHSSLKVKPVYNRGSETKNIGKLYKALVRELKHDWDRNSCSEERIKSILRQTFKNRRFWILSSTTGKLSTIIKEFPCFTSGKYVVYDFLLIINKEDTSTLVKQMETLFSVVGSMMDPVVTPEGNVNAIKILQYMEEQTALLKGKGVAPKSVLVHKVNVPGDETMLHLRTDENTSPHLLIFTAGDNIIDAYIVGDNQVIKTDANTLFDALIVLIATYYTFNLEYPKVFSQVMGLLQTYVIGESYAGLKSNMCTTFIKTLSKNFSSES